MFSTQPELSYNELPSAVVESHLMSRLDVKSVLSSTAVSQTWYHLFVTNDKDWRRRIIEDFNVAENLLIHRDIVKLEINQVYKKLYSKLYIWFKRIAKTEPELVAFTKLPDRLPTLIACCLNHANYTYTMTPHQENEVWLDIAIKLDLLQSFISLSNSQRPLVCSTMNQLHYARAIDAGALDITLYLLTPFELRKAVSHLNERFYQPSIIAMQIDSSPHPKFRSRLLEVLGNSADPWDQGVSRLASNDLLSAIDDNDQPTINFLLGPECSVLPDDRALLHATRKKNIPLVRVFVDQYKLLPDDGTLIAAIEVNSIELVKLFLSKKEFTPFLMIFYKAAYSGNIELFILIQEAFPTLPLEVMTLNHACFSGNLQLVQYIQGNSQLTISMQGLINCICFSKKHESRGIITLLSNPQYQYIDVDNTLLDVAVAYGMLDLVIFLITQKNLMPTTETVMIALRKNKHQIADYLINQTPFIPSSQAVGVAVEHINYYGLQLLLHPKFNYPIHELKLLSNRYQARRFVTPTIQLLYCDILLRDESYILRANHNDDFKINLHRAFSLNITHAARVIMDICLQPDKYNLLPEKNNLMLETLGDYLDTYHNTCPPYAPPLLLIEMINIKVLINTTAASTTNELLQKQLHAIDLKLAKYCQYNPTPRAEAAASTQGVGWVSAERVTQQFLRQA